MTDISILKNGKAKAIRLSTLTDWVLCNESKPVAIITEWMTIQTTGSFTSYPRKIL